MLSGAPLPHAQHNGLSCCCSSIITMQLHARGDKLLIRLKLEQQLEIAGDGCSTPRWLAAWPVYALRFGFHLLPVALQYLATVFPSFSSCATIVLISWLQTSNRDIAPANEAFAVGPDHGLFVASSAEVLRHRHENHFISATLCQPIACCKMRTVLSQRCKVYVPCGPEQTNSGPI